MSTTGTESVQTLLEEMRQDKEKPEKVVGGLNTL